jgi:biotin carboxyl carrier protein
VPDQLSLEKRVVETVAQEPVERSAAARAADHAAIAGSIDGLLPALIAKLGATGLAELEIREDALRVRLRRPPEGAVPHDRRVGDRSGRGDRSRGTTSTAATVGVAHGSLHTPGLTPVGPGRDGREGRTGGDGRDQARADQPQAVATSPAVGIYHPRAEARAGNRVRAGDRLGNVDMLGVPQEVVAPTDGLIGASLVEPGDAVEYGQELVVIEFAGATAGATGAAPTARSPGPATPPTALDH